MYGEIFVNIDFSKHLKWSAVVYENIMTAWLQVDDPWAKKLREKNKAS